MADQRYYEAQEEDLLQSLSVPQYAAGGDETFDEGQYRELEQKALAQHGSVEGGEGQGLEMVPEDVKRFLVLFHQAILENNLPAITSMYEQGWNKLTQAHYAQSEWPEAETIAPLVQNDQVFMTLYRELYFRHVYAKLQPTIDDRFQSYENICELFNYLLNSEGPVPLELPIQWLWDMLDEFVYQFQSFAQWRSNPANKSEDELELLAEAQQIWSCYSVLNVLYSLVQKSQINEQLIAEKQGKSAEEVAEIAGEYGAKPLYRTLGYFSLICLLRVHVLLGDATLALQTMEHVELQGQSLLKSITACHVTTYYHVGAAYMALGRWPDAISTFINVLYYFLRMKQYHTRSYQYHAIQKQCERMYALTAICQALAPGPADESIMAIVKEHYGEQLSKMQRGGDTALETFKDLYLSACPKYLAVNPPPYEDQTALSEFMASPPQDAIARHLDLFLADVKALQGLPGTRNLLKLYTSIDASKLSAFVATGSGSGEQEQQADEEQVLQQIMALKNASRSYIATPAASGSGEQQGGQGSLLDGNRTGINNMDFTVQDSMIHVEETTVHRRTAAFFVRNAEQAQRTFNNIRSAPLPSTQAAQGQAQGQDRDNKGTRGPRRDGKDGQQGQGEKKTWAPKSRQVRIVA